MQEKNQNRYDAGNTAYNKFKHSISTMVLLTSWLDKGLFEIERSGPMAVILGHFSPKLEALVALYVANSFLERVIARLPSVDFRATSVKLCLVVLVA